MATRVIDVEANRMHRSSRKTPRKRCCAGLAVLKLISRGGIYRFGMKFEPREKYRELTRTVTYVR